MTTPRTSPHLAAELHGPYRRASGLRVCQVIKGCEEANLNDLNMTTDTIIQIALNNISFSLNTNRENAQSCYLCWKVSVI